MNPRFDLLPPPFKRCHEKMHYWHRGVLRGRGRCVEMHMNMFLSNETGGRDFPTFDIYCGPSLDPSYLCSLNSFKIVSASCLHESASSIYKHNKIHFFFQDVDFVSPPAPTSSAGDGQRGFRLEYIQIPCST